MAVKSENNPLKINFQLPFVNFQIFCPELDTHIIVVFLFQFSKYYKKRKTLAKRRNANLKIFLNKWFYRHINITNYARLTVIVWES